MQNPVTVITDSVYRESMVERVLQDLCRDGNVTQAGARWYPV